MVFVVDNSATVNTNLFEYRYMLNFIVNVVTELDVDSGRVRVAVITISDKPTVQFHLSTYHTKLDVVGAIRRLPYGGYTADIGTALRSLRTDLFLWVSNTHLLHVQIQGWV